MSKKLSPVVLSWDELERLSDELAGKVEKSGFETELLVGIAVGGLVPLALLSRRLKVREVATITARSYSKTTNEQGKLVVSNAPQMDMRGKRVLLVDEIADSGETLKAVVEILKNKYEVGELRTATLVVNTTHCSAYPDFFVLEVDRWVNFPWEGKLV
jgi:hypoxanthine phosphoribosyltransferase